MCTPVSVKKSSERHGIAAVNSATTKQLKFRRRISRMISIIIVTTIIKVLKLN
jgi:hypothetical protein